MTKKHYKIFFLALLLLLTLTPLQAQESLVLPYKSSDGLWFFFVVQKDHYQIPLRNNSFLDRPSIFVYAAAPKLSEPRQISISFVIYTEEVELINNTKVLKAHIIDSWNISMVVTDDFTQVQVQLPIYENETLLRIQYHDLVLVLRYKINPLFLQTSQELFVKRLIGIVSLVLAILFIAIISMRLARWLLDKVHYIPGDPILILIVTGIFGFMAYTTIQNLQYLDPATYVSIGEFIVSYYNVIILVSSFIVLFIGSLFVFRRYPDEVLMLRFSWNQTPTPETKSFKLRTYVVRGIEKEGFFIKLPESILEFVFFIFGVKQKLIYPDESWYLEDLNNNYKKIFLLDQGFDLNKQKLSIEVNWKYIIILFIALSLLATLSYLSVLGAIILIYIIYSTRDKTKQKIVKKGDEEEIVNEHIPGIKLISIRNKEIKLQLAPAHMKKLFDAFYDLLEKKSLLDFNRKILLELNKALTEKDLAKLEAILTVANEYLGGMEKTLLEKEEEEHD